MTMLPLTWKCVHWIITVFIFIILDVIILIINLNSIILSDERSIWTTFGDAFVNYSLVLAAVGLIYYRLHIMPPQPLRRLIIRMNQFVQYLKVIIFHMVRLNLLSGSQNCISHLWFLYLIFKWISIQSNNKRIRGRSSIIIKPYNEYLKLIY